MFAGHLLISTNIQIDFLSNTLCSLEGNLVWTMSDVHNSKFLHGWGVLLSKIMHVACVLAQLLNTLALETGVLGVLQVLGCWGCCRY